MRPKLFNKPLPEEVLVKGYTQKTIKNRQPARKRLLVSAPMTGNLRSEWVLSRYSQVVPCNWSMTDATVIIDACRGIDVPENNIELSIQAMRMNGVKIITSDNL